MESDDRERAVVDTINHSERAIHEFDMKDRSIVGSRRRDELFPSVRWYLISVWVRVWRQGEQSNIGQSESLTWLKKTPFHISVIWRSASLLPVEASVHIHLISNIERKLPFLLFATSTCCETILWRSSRPWFCLTIECTLESNDAVANESWNYFRDTFISFQSIRRNNIEWIS